MTTSTAAATEKKVAFTKTVLAGVACPEGADRIYVYDAKTPGLAFCVTSTGRRSFYLYKRVQGRPQRIRIGGYPDISIEQARDQAAELNGDIAKGINPQQERRKIRDDASLEDLFKLFLDQHAKPHKKTWREDEKMFDRYLDGWRKRKVGAIAVEDVRALHLRVGSNHGEYAANRLLELLSAMFNFGKRENPCEGVTPFREEKRDRFLQPDEMPRFIKALEDEPNETIRDFVWLCLLTGARRGNVQAMRWDEINFGSSTWRIPETKIGEPQVVPLPAKAVEILKARIGNGSDWVFPARHGKSGHLTEPKTSWAALLKRANITDLRIHDLRRTLGSWQAAAGTSLHIIGKTLGHKNPSTTQIYARLTLDPVRDAVNTATAAMLVAAAKGQEQEQPSQAEVANG